MDSGYTVTAQDFDLGWAAFRPLVFSECRAYQPHPLVGAEILRL